MYSYAHLHIHMNTYIQVYISYTHMFNNTYIIHTYIHACIGTYAHTYIHACMHTYIHTCIHIYVDSYFFA